eukprot:SM000372S13690  [mRNA]  locus=s372:45617:50523:- [translate_table: standard]
MAAVPRRSAVAAALAVPAAVVGARAKSKLEMELLHGIAAAARHLDRLLHHYQMFCCQSQKLQEAWDGVWLAEEPLILPAIPVLGREMSANNAGRALLLEKIERALQTFKVQAASAAQLAAINLAMAQACILSSANFDDEVANCVMQELETECVPRLAADKRILGEIEQELNSRLLAVCDGAGVMQQRSMADFIKQLELAHHDKALHEFQRDSVQQEKASGEHSLSPGHPAMRGDVICTRQHKASAAVCPLKELVTSALTGKTAEPAQQTMEDACTLPEGGGREGSTSGQQQAQQAEASTGDQVNGISTQQLSSEQVTALPQELLQAMPGASSAGEEGSLADKASARGGDDQVRIHQIVEAGEAPAADSARPVSPCRQSSDLQHLSGTGHLRRPAKISTFSSGESLSVQPTSLTSQPLAKLHIHGHDVEHPLHVGLAAPQEYEAELLPGPPDGTLPLSNTEQPPAAEKGSREAAIDHPLHVREALAIADVPAAAAETSAQDLSATKERQIPDTDFAGNSGRQLAGQCVVEVCHGKSGSLSSNRLEDEKVAAAVVHSGLGALGCLGSSCTEALESASRPVKENVPEIGAMDVDQQRATSPSAEVYVAVTERKQLADCCGGSQLAKPLIAQGPLSTPSLKRKWSEEEEGQLVIKTARGPVTDIAADGQQPGASSQQGINSYEAILSSRVVVTSSAADPASSPRTGAAAPKPCCVEAGASMEGNPPPPVQHCSAPLSSHTRQFRFSSESEPPSESTTSPTAPKKASSDTTGRHCGGRSSTKASSSTDGAQLPCHEDDGCSLMDGTSVEEDGHLRCAAMGVCDLPGKRVLADIRTVTAIMSVVGGPISPKAPLQSQLPVCQPQPAVHQLAPQVGQVLSTLDFHDDHTLAGAPSALPQLNPLPPAALYEHPGAMGAGDAVAGSSQLLLVARPCGLVGLPMDCGAQSLQTGLPVGLVEDADSAQSSQSSPIC